jgi:hypothetical protein
VTGNGVNVVTANYRALPRTAEGGCPNRSLAFWNQPTCSLRKISVALALGVRVTKVRCSGDGCSPIILQLLLRPAETKELRSGNQECPREPAPN